MIDQTGTTDAFLRRVVASGRRPMVVIALLAACFCGLGFRAIQDAHATTDEPYHYRYGYRMLRGEADRWEGDDSKMPVSALNALPCWAAERLGSTLHDEDEFSGPCNWSLGRLPTLAAGLALGFAIALWSKTLFGWPGALVSFGLFAFEPNLIAHSSLITTDTFGMLFMLLALRAFASWLKRPDLKESGTLGFFTGAAALSKYTSVYLPLLFLLSAVACRWIFGAAKFPGHGHWLRGIVVALTAALAVVNLGFLGEGTGSSLQEQELTSRAFRRVQETSLIGAIPLPLPRPFIQGLDRVLQRERTGEGFGNIYFLGERRGDGAPGFAAYFLVLTLVKTTLPVLLALGLTTILFLRRRGAEWRVDEVILATSVVTLVLYFSLLFRAQIGLRHFLVIFPFMFVLAGRLGVFLAESRARVALGTLALALSAASVIRHGDDPLSYFNELVDPARTYEIAADSNLDWGQSLNRVNAYMAAHPGTLIAPARPFPGRILVGGNLLTGVVAPRRMKWLRDSGIAPVGQVAYTHFLFDVTPAQASRLREESGDPPLPPSR